MLNSRTRSSSGSLVISNIRTCDRTTGVAERILPPDEAALEHRRRRLARRDGGKQERDRLATAAGTGTFADRPPAAGTME